MARSATLESLRDQVRQRSDTENSTERFPDAELNEYINQSWAELYELIIQAGSDLYLSSSPITTSNAIDAYALPADFYQLRGVDVDVGFDMPITMRMYTYESRNSYIYRSGWAFGQPVAYRLQGSNILFRPTPTAAYQVTVYYYPAPDRMVDDVDSIDGVAGWEEYVVADAALKVVTKDDRDPSTLAAMKGAMLKRVMDAAAQRNAGEPERVGDVDGVAWWWHGPS